jgi:hypothetical protein
MLPIRKRANRALRKLVSDEEDRNATQGCIKMNEHYQHPLCQMGLSSESELLMKKIAM